MKHYKTVNEVKQNLPEILDRIDTCKIYFDCATMMLKDMERWCVEETTNESINYGWWTSLRAYSETVKNQIQYLSEIEYLTGLLDRLPQYKNQTVQLRLVRRACKAAS